MLSREDIQDLRQMFGSSAWKIVESEVHKEIDRNKEACMVEAEMRNVLIRQGQHLAMEWFLRLKEDLLEEERKADEVAAAEVREETP